MINIFQKNTCILSFEEFGITQYGRTKVGEYRKEKEEKNKKEKEEEEIL